MGEANVSRETMPEVARELAGENLDKLRQFAADLEDRGELLGLIGPLEVPRLWTRHIVNSALLAPLIEQNAQVADVGTGGGLPGLVLAIVRPDAHFRLIEPMERRCDWLREQIEKLELKNTAVLRGRVEEFHGAFEVDQITARAVTSLKKLIPITAPMLRPGGEFLFLKGQSVDAEITAAQKVLRRHRVENARAEVLGEGVTEITRVFRANV